MEYGPVAPFDAAVVVLLLASGIVLFTWTENYGDQARGGRGR